MARLPPGQLATTLATAVEAHVAHLIDELVRYSQVGASDFGRGLLDHAKDDFSRNWDSRANWLKAFKINIKDDPSYRDFDLLVNARNAVVHGEGRLTPLQTQKLNTTVSLKQNLQRHLDITAHGELRFGPSSAQLMAQAARGYVLFLDRTFVASHPHLHNA